MTPSPAFNKENIDVLRTMIKEHDQQAKAKENPKKLVYGSFGEEDSDSLGTKGLSKQLFNESSGTSGTQYRARSTGKSQGSLSRSRVSSHLRRFERLENRSKSKAKSREERTKVRGKRSKPRKASPNADYGCYLIKSHEIYRNYKERKKFRERNRKKENGGFYYEKMRSNTLP
ncbi:hypothetical protein Tco_0520310 [Tanacetum coccineum]